MKMERPVRIERDCKERFDLPPDVLQKDNQRRRHVVGWISGLGGEGRRSTKDGRTSTRG